MTVTCPASVIYNGAAQAPCTATYTTADGLSGSLNVSYGANTDSGTAIASATYTGDADHQASSNSADFAIGKAASIVTVTCPTTVRTYTGWRLRAARRLTRAQAAGRHADAGLRQQRQRGDGDRHRQLRRRFQLRGEQQQRNLRHRQGPVGCDGELPNDGADLHRLGDSGLHGVLLGAGGLTGTLTPTYVDNVSVGTATASASYLGGPNHEATAAARTFTVGSASSTTVVTCPASVTYSGSGQTPCTATYSTPDGLSGSLAVSYTANADAGQANATAAYLGDTNHAGRRHGHLHDPQGAVGRRSDVHAERHLHGPAAGP